MLWRGVEYYKNHARLSMSIWSLSNFGYRRVPEAGLNVFS